MTIRDQITTALSMRLPLPAILEREIIMPACLSGRIGPSILRSLSGVMGKLSPCAQPRSAVSHSHRSISKENDSFHVAGRLACSREGFYVVEGVLFSVDQETWVVGALKSGALVRVRGSIMADGKRLATKVTSVPA